jgi:hypothetical protein
MRFDLHHHHDDSIVELTRAFVALRAEMNRRFDALTELIIKESKVTQADFDLIAAEVTKETDVVTSATALMDQLTALIKANQNDPTLGPKLLSLIDANKDKLAASVVANTPAAPAA